MTNNVFRNLAAFIACLISFLTAIETRADQDQNVATIELAPTFDGRNRATPIRIVYKDDRVVRGLIVFSHGANSDNGQYDRLLFGWAEAGFVVVAPTHLDSETNPDRAKFTRAEIMSTRISELSASMDIAAHLPSQAGDLATKLTGIPVAAAGHSYGALIAQVLGGATLNGGAIDQKSSRVQAVVSISPPGSFGDVLTKESFAAYSTPMLVTTGTNDILPGFIDDWQAHLFSHEMALPGDQYALVTQGVDHYFGNLIGRLSLDGPPQNEGIETAIDVSIAFLEAYLNSKPSRLDEFAQSKGIEKNSQLMKR